MDKARLHHHSNVRWQWLQLHYQKRGYTAKENRPEEEENHIVNPLYKHFLENYRPVAKKIENGINKSTGSVKYPDEENYTEIKEAEDDNEEDDSVIPDPEYKLFLEHLRPDRKSYVLEIVEANVYVKYEPPIENESHVEMHAPAKYSGKLYTDKSANGGCNHVASEAQNHADNHTGQHSGGEQSGQELSPHKNLNGSASNNYVASKPQNHAPSCSGKRRGRKPKGLSKIQATENPNGDSNQVVTEENRHDRSGTQMDKCRGREQKGQQLSADKNATVSNSSNQIGLEVQNRDLNYKGKHRGRKPKAGPELCDTKNNGDNSSHLVSEAHKHDRHRSNKVKKNVVPSVQGRKISGVKEESDDDVQHIRRLVHCPVLNVRFLCEDNDEANVRKLTKYREKLMEELKKPYCQEEYERLFKDITIRKQAQGQRVLRGCTKTYDESHVSNSYLDCHMDLKRKIDTDPDDYTKVLNLMRGYFYWLVNISHEGVFRPWRVQPYLDELLQH